MIKWNEYTWYSKLGAVILFIGIIPALTFYIGIQYEKTREVLTNQYSSSIFYSNQDLKNDTSASSTASWKTYSNQTYDYSLKYPANWSVHTQYSDSPFEDRARDGDIIGGDTYVSSYSDTYIKNNSGENGMFDLPKNSISTDILFYKVNATSTLLNFIKDHHIETDQIEDISLNGVSGIKITNTNMTGNSYPNVVNVLLKNGNKIVSLSYGFTGNTEEQAQKEIADEIINSFTFAR